MDDHKFWQKPSGKEQNASASTGNGMKFPFIYGPAKTKKKTHQASSYVADTKFLVWQTFHFGIFQHFAVFNRSSASALLLVPFQRYDAMMLLYIVNEIDGCACFSHIDIHIIFSHSFLLVYSFIFAGRVVYSTYSSSYIPSTPLMHQ
jgi:hypothetical protein